jgi:hypothetical protein
MILKLLRQHGVLSEGEYQAAMASELNIAGMQRKVDQSVTMPPVFASPSSARSNNDNKSTEEQGGTAPETGKTPAADTTPEQPSAKQQAEPAAEKP